MLALRLCSLGPPGQQLATPGLPPYGHSCTLTSSVWVGSPVHNPSNPEVTQQFPDGALLHVARGAQGPRLYTYLLDIVDQKVCNVLDVAVIVLLPMKSIRVKEDPVQ